jgi:hypothetical protein
MHIVMQRQRGLQPKVSLKVLEEMAQREKGVPDMQGNT